jgi:hypothetical protein
MFKLRIKPKSMNTTISVICYKSKTLANGEHPLMLRITQNRKTQYKSLNISVAAKHWDFEKKIRCPVFLPSTLFQYGLSKFLLQDNGRFCNAGRQPLPL